jgi:hypothetical protein
MVERMVIPRVKTAALLLILYNDRELIAFKVYGA